MKPETSFWNFGHSNFDIVSDFDIRNWDFILCGPFGGVYPDRGRAQDRLGANNFIEMVLLNILSVRI